jgi:membrane protein DedA with SNARE-associated domain
MPGFDLFAGWSYLGIVVFLILTGCGFPLPEEVAFVYAGVQSALGHLHWPLAIGACAVGALLGDSVMYGVGRLGRGWIRKHAWFSRIVHLEREEQVRRLIATHGIKVFFAARFLVGVRGPLYVTLGILKVPFWRFVLIDSVCASAVIGVFFSLSYFFGQSVLLWIQRGEKLFTFVAIAVVVVAGAVWFVYYRREKRKSLEATRPPERDEHLDAVTESLLGVPHEELTRDVPEVESPVEEHSTHATGNGQPIAHAEAAHAADQEPLHSNDAAPNTRQR